MSAIYVGLGISSAAGRGADPVAAAVEAEELGFDFVSTSDHPAGDQPTYETATLLTWIAARTTRIAVASRVLGVPFRLPALVAKSAESLQRLSGGRLVLGLGGGHSDDEIRALGARPASPRDKVDGLAEAISIMRGVWTQQAFTRSGRIHSVADLDIEPKPEQPIPIWLGTYGPRALGVTGRLADGWIPSLGFAPPRQIPELLDRIRTASVASGRSPTAVRAIYNVPVRLDPAATRVPDEVAGSASDVVEQLRAFVDLGFAGFNLMPAPGQARAVGEEVLPALRG